MIRVPLATRDRVRAAAATSDSTFAEVIERGLDLVDQDRFWQRVSQIEPDSDYREEFSAWDD